jgi:hypothetical protein
MLSAKDLITENNVLETKNEGKYIMFLLKNGVRVKIDPNEAGLGDSVKKHVKEGK